MASIEPKVYRYFAFVGGWRFVVVVHSGRKIVKLLDTSSLDVYRVTPNELRSLKPYPKIRGFAKSLKEKRALYKRLNLSYPNTHIKKALSVLAGKEITSA